MAITLNISGTIIEFPSSSQDPNWSEGVIQFAEAVTSALSGLAGAFDVPPTVYSIDSFNPTPSPTDLPGAAFATSNVRAVYLEITVFRSTDTTSVYEADDIIAVYSPDNPIGNKWEFSRSVVGDGQITFSITDTGQLQFTTAAIAGASHTGKITYTAKALLQSS